MAHPILPPSHPEAARVPGLVAIQATTATLAARQVVLERRHQETVATAQAICHVSRVHLARQRVTRQRRGGQQVGPLAWFALQGVIGERVVRGVWAGGQLTCDRPLASRAQLLVDLGVEFGDDDPPRRFLASLQAPPVAVLLTLIWACDLTTQLQVDLGAHP